MIHITRHHIHTIDDNDNTTKKNCYFLFTEIQVPTQGSHTSARNRSTCPVDLLTIIFLQLLLMPAVFQYLKDSNHHIYV